MSRKILLVLTALLTITMSGFGAGCLPADTTADQNFDGSDQVSLQDSDTTGLLDSDTVGLEDDDTLAMQGDDAGIEPEAVNPNAPPAANNPSAMANGCDLDVFWSFVLGTYGYKIYCRPKGSSTWRLVYANPSALVGGNYVYHISSLYTKPGKIYYIKIVTFNSYGKTPSNIVWAMTLLADCP